MKKTKKLLAIFLAFALLVGGIVVPESKASNETLTNLFNKSSSENQDGVYINASGNTVSTSDYSQLFTTHKIAAKKGDIIYWGDSGDETYVLSLWDASGNFIRAVDKKYVAKDQITTTKVAGIGYKSGERHLYRWAYEIKAENTAYVRILSNKAQKSSLVVYKNMKDASEWPIPALTETNLFDKRNPGNQMYATSQYGYNWSHKNTTEPYFENLFVTHLMPAQMNDIVYWGGVGTEDRVLQVYDKDGSFLYDVAKTDTGLTIEEIAGTSIKGYNNGGRTICTYSYQIKHPDAAYFSVTANISNMDSLQVYVNLQDTADFAAYKDSNLFKKNDSGNEDYTIWKARTDSTTGALTGTAAATTDETKQANLFTTHQVTVAKGQTLVWGPAGDDTHYVLIYNSSGTVVERVYWDGKTALPTGFTYTEVGGTVAGYNNGSRDKKVYTYKITASDAAYACITGNISLKSEMKVYAIESSIISSADESNNLKGKTALFVGDSITYGRSDRGGWAKRIAQQNGMRVTNGGVSGASVSSNKKDRTIAQLQAHSNSDYDYVIMHGGVNDAMTATTVGKVTSSKDSTFDTSTYAGALEEMFKYAYENYAPAKFGFIINYATPNSTWTSKGLNGKTGSTTDMSAYFDVARQVCEKWDIPYLDLYEGSANVNGVLKSYSYDILKVNTGTHLQNEDVGEVHLSPSGYDVITPYITEWMQTLEITDNVMKDKAVLFVGDSVTYGLRDHRLSGVAPENNVDATVAGGWAARIGEAHGMNWINAGKAGALVSTTASANGAAAIPTQLEKYADETFDYVIMHGGLNDIFQNAPLGTMTASKTGTFDTSTFAGALENMFKYAHEKYPAAKLGFIINYAIPPKSEYRHSDFEYDDYFNLAKQICDKWNVPYLDLYDGTVEVGDETLSYSFDILKTSSLTYINDNLHINSAGYDAITPYICQWMETLPDATTDIGANEARLTGNNLTLDGTIHANFYMDLGSQILTNKKAYLKATTENGHVEQVSVSQADATGHGYRFSVEVVAKEMADDITVQLYDEKGKIGEEYHFCVRDYAWRIINAGAEGYGQVTIDLMKDMLNYGGYAQSYFKYHTGEGEFANSYFASTDKDVSSVTAESLVGYKRQGQKHTNFGSVAGSSLVLESETTLKVFFKLNSGLSMDKVYIKVDGKDANISKSGTYYVVSITDIPAQDLDDIYVINFTDANGNSWDVDYSPMSYCYNAISRSSSSEQLQNFMKALRLYNLSAKAFVKDWRK